jgi:hypothetical protein
MANMNLKYRTLTEKVLNVTPELASWFMENNYSNNRKVRATKVSQYASDMKEGRWDKRISMIQDPIIFNTSGYMENGQHRCLACIQSGSSFETRVLFGVYDPDGSLYRSMDNGCVRNTADLVDVPNANSVSALARTYVALSEGDAPLLSAIQGKMTVVKKKITTPSKARIIETINEKTELFEKIHSLGIKLASPFGRQRGAFKDAVLLIEFVGRGDVLEEFTEDFGSSISTNPSIIACKSYMTKCFCNKNFDSSPRWVLGCVLSAYEHYRSKTTASCYNKLEAAYEKYDKFLKEARTR